MISEFASWLIVGGGVVFLVATIIWINRVFADIEKYLDVRDRMRRRDEMREEFGPLFSDEWQPKSPGNITTRRYP